MLYTKEEIISRIEANDIEFIIALIVDNNPTAVKDNLAREGLLSLSSANYSKQELFDSVKALYLNSEGDKLRRVLSVPYSEGSDSAYTRGLSSYIEKRERSDSNHRGAFTNNWGPILGVVLSTAGLLITQSQSPSGENQSESTPNQDVTTEKNEDEILGVKPVLFWGLIVFVVAVSLVLILSKRNK
jgi:hypothetical protein